MKDVNPLLSRVSMPGETYQLPSKGLFYTNGELSDDVTNAEVYIQPMTVIDEIAIKTPDLLFNGKAVEQIFKRCIPQIQKPTLMLAKDIDFLIVCLKKVSYGQYTNIDYMHNCENAKSNSYQIDVSDFIQKSRALDPTTSVDVFTVKLDNGQVVKLRPIRFGDFIQVMQASEETKDGAIPSEIMKTVISSLVSVIESVDEVSDPDQIAGWLSVVSPKVLNTIRDRIEDTLNWGVQFKTTITCQDCKETELISIPMNPLTFFS